MDHAERRARLARRHAVVPGHRAADVESAAAAMVGLHATDPASLYLSAWARVEGMTTDDLDRALYRERTLVKHLAMRRTLFVVPRELLGVVQAAASERVADSERRRLIREVARNGLHADPERWLAEASAAVLEALVGGRQATSSQLRAEIPLLDGSMVYGGGRTWGGSVPIAPRVLTVLSAAGRILRASNLGGWTTSRPTWASTECWLGHDIDVVPQQEANAALVLRWLRVFGPGTAEDLRWWMGSTLTAVRRALGDLGAVEVEIDGRVGYVMPDDLEPTEPVAAWVALLPSLDPTTMGWFGRDWYLGPHRGQLFDSSGNAGQTAWCDGRVVGGWRQTDAGEVVVDLLEDVGREARSALQDEAARLTVWLGGVRVLPRFPSPLSRSAAGT
jgi:hypothetical protein